MHCSSRAIPESMQCLFGKSESKTFHTHCVCAVFGAIGAKVVARAVNGTRVAISHTYPFLSLATLLLQSLCPRTPHTLVGRGR